MNLALDDYRLGLHENAFAVAIETVDATFVVNTDGWEGRSVSVHVKDAPLEHRSLTPTEARSLARALVAVAEEAER